MRAFHNIPGVPREKMERWNAYSAGRSVFEPTGNYKFYAYLILLTSSDSTPIPISQQMVFY